MKNLRICFDGSSCWHMRATSSRAKRPGLHVQYLLVQLLIVLLAGQASCQTTTAASAPGNAETLVNYFLDVTVTGTERTEDDIDRWLRDVFQKHLQSCVTTAAPTSPSVTTSQIFNSSITAVATTTSKTTGTTTTATSTELQSSSASTAAPTTTTAATTATTPSPTTATPATTATTAAPTTSTPATTATTAAPTTSTPATTATTPVPTTATPATTANTAAPTTSTPATTATTPSPTTATPAKTTTTAAPTTTTPATTATTPSPTTATPAKTTTTAAPTTSTTAKTATTAAQTTTTESSMATTATTAAAPLNTIIVVVPAPVSEGASDPRPPESDPEDRNVLNRVARNSGDTPGLVEELTVSCITAIRNTDCEVRLTLNQRVPPCCVLRKLCEASKDSSDIKAVARKADITNPISEDCEKNPQEAQSCIYTGGESESCELPAFNSSSSCKAEKKNGTCSCSSYCSGTDKYYAFEISIQDPEISFERVKSLLSKLKDPITCPTTDAECQPLTIASEFKESKLTCASTTINLQNCNVVLTYTSEVPICNVSAAVLHVFELENQITPTRPVTSAALCPNEEVSSTESQFTWVQGPQSPGLFCESESSLFKCKNGEDLLFLMEQKCELFTTTTIAPNATTLNAEEEANALLELTRDVSRLNASQVNQLVSELERLLSGPNVSLSLGNTSVQIVSNLLGASPEVLSESSNRVIGIVDTVGVKLVVDEAAETLLSPDVALSVKPVDGANFQETVFSISSPSDVQLTGGSRLGRSQRSDSSIPQGSIKLPASLTQNLSAAEQELVSRLQFTFYQQSTVFQDRSLGLRTLNSGILGSSVANMSISGLQEPVVINLRNFQPVPANFVATCVFWDFTQNDGSGGWNRDGCSVQNSTDNETVCGCTHLTSFAILLDLSRTPLTSRLQATILTFITFIGCGISAIFLSFTLLTYLLFGKLRKDIPSKILIQLCLALLLLNLVFLVDAWLALYPDAIGLCISTAWFLHYFLLVSFTWMGLEAVHMYVALVKVFTNHISRYMLKFSLVGWGVPMIVVIIVIAINKDNYGLISYGRFPDGTSDEFCWLKEDIAFYVAVVAYFCAIFLFNMIMFVVVLVQLCRLKRQNPQNSAHRTTLQDVRSVVGITLLLGLTWGFAFFAWGVLNLPFMYLFAIFNALQGFFIFLFHCVVKESVRRQWRMYLCCGKMRLLENSDWSRTATQKHPKNSSVDRVASSKSAKSNNSSSSSFLVNDSPENGNGFSNHVDDRAMTADEEPSADVILNEINSQARHRQVR